MSFLERAIYWSICRRVIRLTSDKRWPGTDLEGVVKVSDFTKAVQKLVDSCLIVFHKGIEGCHVKFLRIGRLVCQILKHLCDLHRVSTEARSLIADTHQRQCPSRVLGRNAVNQHVCLWCDDSRIDKPKEEETPDK